MNLRIVDGLAHNNNTGIGKILWVNCLSPVARRKLPKELFDAIWQEALELQNEKTDK
jgi:hypothetical protein